MPALIAQQPVLALSTGLIVAGVVVAIILIVGIALISMYNGLVRLRVTSKESWSDIDTELQRRHDLIPNLISTVKGYASHEKGLFEKVMELRNQAVALEIHLFADHFPSLLRGGQPACLTL